MLNWRESDTMRDGIAALSSGAIVGSHRIVTPSVCVLPGTRGRWNLELFAILQINEVYIGREIQLYYLFA